MSDTQKKAVLTIEFTPDTGETKITGSIPNPTVGFMMASVLYQTLLGQMRMAMAVSGSRLIAPDPTWRPRGPQA